MMKMLPKEVLRVPDRHAFAYGCRNVVYLAGYIHSMDHRTLRLMLTNNVNLVLPVLLSPATQPPRRFAERSQVKVTATIRGYKDATGRHRLAVYARGYETPNLLELPLRSAWDKAVPVQSDEIRDFKPFGAGHRASAACNSVELAGFVSGIRLDRAHRVTSEESEAEAGEVGEGLGAANGKVEILIRQSKHPDQDIPLTYYGRFAHTLLDRISVGVPISVMGHYRVRPVETGEIDGQGKAKVLIEPYIHIDLPQTATPHHIRFIEKPDEYPDWVKQLSSGPARRRRPEVPAGAPIATTDDTGGMKLNGSVPLVAPDAVGAEAGLR